MDNLTLNPRKFRIACLAGFGTLLVIVFTFIISGLVFATPIYPPPIAGLGGFTVEANSIYGEGFYLVPTIGDTNLGYENDATDEQERSVFPMFQITMDSGDMTGVTISKYLDLSPLGPALSLLQQDLGRDVQYVVAVVKAAHDGGTSGATSLMMNATYIEADNASFNTMEMDENLDVPPDVATDLCPNDKAPIGLKANNLSMEDACITTHMLKVGSISLPGLSVSLQLYDGNDLEVNPPFNAQTPPW